MLRRIVHTAEGLAPVVVQETRSAGGTAEAPPAATWVEIRAPEAAVAALRTVDAALAPLGASAPTPAPDGALAAIEAHVGRVEVPGLDAAESFRVRAVVDAPGLDRRAVAGRVGRLLAERSGTRVDLTRPALTVWVAVGPDRWWLALDAGWTEPRAPRPFHQRTGLRAILAAGAVTLSALRAPRHILDPYCGGGTVLLEAAARHPAAEVIGGDWIAKAAAGARANLEAAGARARVRHADARDIVAAYPAESVDAVLTNPPFGVQVGHGIRFHGFYAQLLAAARHVLRPGGRLTLFTDRRPTLEAAAERVGGFEPFAEARVRAGGLAPWILSFTRR